MFEAEAGGQRGLLPQVHLVTGGPGPGQTGTGRPFVRDRKFQMNCDSSD